VSHPFAALRLRRQAPGFARQRRRLAAAARGVGRPAAISLSRCGSRNTAPGRRPT